MKTLLSDDGQYVLVFDEDTEEPEQFTKEEFEVAYGEDAEDAVRIPEKKKSVDDDLKHYYRAFRELCQCCGEYAWINKLAQNVQEGILPAQEVAFIYFGGTKGDPDVNITKTIENAYRAQVQAAKYLDGWSQRLGYKPMSEIDRRILIQHLYRPGFRKKMRYRIDRNLRKGISASARDLVLEVLRAEKKLRGR